MLPLPEVSSSQSDVDSVAGTCKPEHIFFEEMGLRY